MAKLGRRSFLRLAGAGASTGWLGLAPRRRRTLADESGPVPQVPTGEYRAFALTDVAPAPGEFRRDQGASYLALPGGSGLLVFSHCNGAETAGLWARRLDREGVPDGPARALRLPREADEHLEAGALRRLPGGEIGLLYSRRLGEGECARCFSTSRDGGTTWSEPYVVAAGNYRSGCHDGLLVHSSGRLLAPLECGENWSEHHFYSRVARSDDGGRSWELADRIELPPVGGRLGCGWLDSGCFAPMVVERADGSLLMAIGTAMGTLFASESSDGGASWSRPCSLEVRSAPSPAHLSRLPGSRELLLIWNPDFDPSAEGFGARHTVMAAVSADGGRSWPLFRRRVLWHDPGSAGDCPAVTFRNGEAWVLLRFTRGTFPGKGPAATGLMRVPVDWFA